MSLIDVDDPGMLVLPTHRLLTNLAPTMQAQLTGEQLKRYFTVETLATRASKDVIAHLEKAGQEQPAFVILTNEQALLLRLTEQGRHYMDVAIAQRLLLEETLGLRAEDMTAGTYVRYSHDADYVFAAVEKGEAQAALLLNSTPLRQVCEVAQADDRMPQKSTYLYPKLITGLVMNPLW
jgi:uncharacterized protein (DUF1015 family)